MSDTFGLLELPVPVPDDPRTESAGDPVLDVIAAFVRAVLIFEIGAAWNNLYPGKPLVFTDTHAPDESAFTSKRTPCLFVYRADSPEPQRVRSTQSWEIVRCPVALLLVPPPPTQDKQKLRTKMRNAVDKAVRAAIRQGRHPAWVVPGDTYYDAATYGSVLVRHAKLHSTPMFSGFRRHALTIEDEKGNRGTPFPGLLATLLIDERLERGTDRYDELSHIQGGVTVGNDETGENGVAFGSYKFQPSLLSCSPAIGSIAGGTSVTLRGHQFTLDEDDAGLTVALDDGTELEDVELVDESTITATMPAHAAGAVGLVATMPSGATAVLASAFTYS